MTPPDVLRASTEAEIGHEIIRLVPHWYEAECGPQRYAVPIGGHTAHFYNHCKLTPNLRTFLGQICARTRELTMEHFIRLPGLTDVLLENFAIEWLRIHSATIDWVRLIKYMETVARRTYENQPVAVNLLIREGEGTGDITEPDLQKFLDRLAASAFSYLMVDPDLRLMDYGEVEWGQVKTPRHYQFHPEFLHPIHSIMKPRDLSAHLTAQGDVVIMNQAGLLAARRRRKWKVYDVRTFKNSLAQCMGNRHVGGNLFQVIFDLSFRRQGALLIYDPRHCMQPHVLNSESFVASEWRAGADPEEPDSGQALLARLLADTAVGTKAGSLRRKRRLIEMACVDGAVIFDDAQLLAVGALIRSHPSVGSQLGARTTAARSAYLWGSHPIKVSSDGDVTIYFQSKNRDNQCDSEMHFL